MSEFFTDQLKRAIRESGMSRYALSKATGVDQGTLSKFLSGQRSISLDSVDKLVDVLGLTLTAQKKRGGVELRSTAPLDPHP
jgi:transcriptional regulator with XRE-family HTH domain